MGLMRKITLELTEEQARGLEQQFGLELTRFVVEGELTAMSAQKASFEKRKAPAALPQQEAGEGKVWVTTELDAVLTGHELADDELEAVAGAGPGTIGWYQDTYKAL